MGNSFKNNSGEWKKYHSSILQYYFTGSTKSVKLLFPKERIFPGPSFDF